MKTKKILITGMLCMAMGVQAQTDFRPLDLKGAIAAAKAEGKQVFVDIYTDWCGPCKMMAKQVFPTEKAGNYFNEKFVNIKLNAEKEGKEDVKRFHITGYPTFVVLDAEGKELGNHSGATSDVDKFIGIIESIANPELTPKRMAERYAAGDRDPQLIAVYANAMIEEAYQGRTPHTKLLEKATDMVNDYFMSMSDDNRLKPENIFVYSPIYMQKASDPKVAFVNKNIKKLRKDAQYQDVVKAVNNFYLMKIQQWAADEHLPDAEEYAAVRRDIARYGYDTDGIYKAAYAIIDAHTTGDMNQYMDVCELYFDKLPIEIKEAILTNMKDLLGGDKAVLARGARFMRQQFLTVPASTIFFASRTLQSIEKGLSD